MKMMKIGCSSVSVFVVIFAACCSCCCIAATQTALRMTTATSSDVQAETVRQMLQRKLPDHFQKFSIHVHQDLGPEGKDTFKISSSTSENSTLIEITGSSGVAASYGVLYYLKTFCNAHVSWEADQLDLSDLLPPAEIQITSNDRFRYYQNVCTPSYTYVWWNWERWERHIDWMALNGINLPLALTGQETIWYKVYKKFNLTEEELDDHFAGPPFLAWGRMGNIKGWGGPLTESWMTQRLVLQHKILSRMRSFGMTPVLPAFAGHVPKGIQRVFPDAKIERMKQWSRFESKYTRTYFLDPRDPVFGQIGEAFIREMALEFNGTDHYYNCDTFNEMVPPSNSPTYLATVGRSVYHAMLKADPEAIWVMQGWLFLDDEHFWSYEPSRALLTSVPQGRMLVLDLAGDTNPVYNRLDSFFGQPFIFCMLHNFGGVKGMYGNVEMLLKNVADARSYPNSSIAGIGLTMEGIEQNYVVYDFMLELGWKDTDMDTLEWASEYSLRRYGNISQQLLGESWRLLMKGIYNSPFGIKFHGSNILMMHRPNFGRTLMRWYDEDGLIKAWDLMVQAAEENKKAVILKNQHISDQPSKPNTEEEKSDNVTSFTTPKAGSMANVENIILNEEEKAILLEIREKLEKEFKINVKTHDVSSFTIMNELYSEGDKDSLKKHEGIVAEKPEEEIEKSEEEIGKSEEEETRKSEGKLVVEEIQLVSGENKKAFEEKSENMTKSKEELTESQELSDDSSEISDQFGKAYNENISQTLNGNQGPIQDNSMKNVKLEEPNQDELGNHGQILGNSLKNLTLEEPNQDELGNQGQILGNSLKNITIEEPNEDELGINGGKNLNNQPTFRYDLIDLTREVLQNHADHLILQQRYAYYMRSEPLVRYIGHQLAELLTDLDSLLATNENFKMSPYVRRAESWATSEKERAQLVSNFHNQVSLWGPRAEILDYAVKQWSRLVKDYVVPRWQMFTEYLVKAIRDNSQFEKDAFEKDVFFNVEQKFGTRTKAVCASEETEDSIEKVIEIYTKYRKYFK